MDPSQLYCVPWRPTSSVSPKMAAGKGQYAVNFDVVGSQTVTQSSFINVHDQVGNAN
jgi:hypothetical protein